MYEEQFEFLIDYNTILLRLCFEILRWEKDIVFSASNQFPPMETERSKIPDKKIGTSNNHRQKNRGKPTSKFMEYHQVFEEKHGFIADVSILDLIFNQGNEARTYLEFIGGSLDF